MIFESCWNSLNLRETPVGSWRTRCQVLLYWIWRPDDPRIVSDETTRTVPPGWPTSSIHTSQKGREILAWQLQIVAWKLCTGEKGELAAKCVVDDLCSSGSCGWCCTFKSSSKGSTPIWDHNSNLNWIMAKSGCNILAITHSSVNQSIYTASVTIKFVSKCFATGWTQKACATIFTTNQFWLGPNQQQLMVMLACWTWINPWPAIFPFWNQ